MTQKGSHRFFAYIWQTSPQTSLFLIVVRNELLFVCLISSRSAMFTFVADDYFTTGRTIMLLSPCGFSAFTRVMRRSSSTTKV